MQNNFQVKYSGRSQLEGEPRSVSALSQRSTLSPNIFNSGFNNFTGAFPQPKRTSKERIGKFVYPARKSLQQPDEVDPNETATVSNNGESESEERRPFPAFKGNSVPKWSKLHTAYSKKKS